MSLLGSFDPSFALRSNIFNVFKFKSVSLLVLMGMICAAMGVTFVGHRTYIDTASTASTLVTPFLISVALSDDMYCAFSGYDSVMNAFKRALFPLSRPGYSHLNPRVSTREKLRSCAYTSISRPNTLKLACLTVDVIIQCRY